MIDEDRSRMAKELASVGTQLRARRGLEAMGASAEVIDQHLAALAGTPPDPNDEAAAWVALQWIEAAGLKIVRP